MLLSADGQNDPDILAMNGASAALCVSDIPFAGPIGAVRVGRVNGQFVANPTHAEREQSDLDLVYVGTENDVIMIEGAANEVPEAEFVKALEFAHGHAREMIRIQKELAAQVGKPKREMPLLHVDPTLLDIAYQVAGDKIEGALYTEGKVARTKAVEALREEVKAAILEKHPEADKFAISQAFDYVQKKAFRKSILEKQKRMDGRGYQDLRQITCEVGVLPRAHGSAIFQRGETQALALATLAPIEEAQNIDAYGGGENSKRFILHYNFPPFSVGETGPHRRREPARDRSRRAGRAFARTGCAERKRFSLRHPHLQRDHGIKWIDLDGQRVRRNARAHGRRRAGQRNGRGNFRRPRHRTRRRSTIEALRIADRHHRFGRSFRRHGFQTLRHR